MTGPDVVVVLMSKRVVVVSPAVTGSLFRLNMGLKGLVAGGSVGGTLG